MSLEGSESRTRTRTRVDLAWSIMMQAQGCIIFWPGAPRCSGQGIRARESPLPLPPSFRATGRGHPRLLWMVRRMPEQQGVKSVAGPVEKTRRDCTCLPLSSLPPSPLPSDPPREPRWPRTAHAPALQVATQQLGAVGSARGRLGTGSDRLRPPQAGWVEGRGARAHSQLEHPLALHHQGPVGGRHGPHPAGLLGRRGLVRVGRRQQRRHAGGQERGCCQPRHGEAVPRAG